VTSGPVRRAITSGLRRKLMQTTVIGLVLLISAGASVLGLALVADSNAPFDTAFAAQHGADVAATFSPARVTDSELATTRQLPVVIATAGPFAEVAASLMASVSGGAGGSAELMLPFMTLAGRASPGGPVDDISLQSGRWVTGPGQIVLSSTSNLPAGLAVGDLIMMTNAPGKPKLTLVGLATSVTGSADGWVAPAEIARLTGPTAAASTQMLYRFASAGTSAAIRADMAAVSRALPAGAVAATLSYLSVRMQESSGVAPLAPFVAAFGLIGLVMAALIVVNVISGAVVSGYYRIGVLKSIGFTPGQVTAIYIGQALVPAAAGCLAGLVLGNLLAGALLNRAASAFQVGTLGVPAWVNLSVLAAMLILVGIAALLPAIRAGRLSAIQASAAGRAPRQGGGYAAHRLLGRIRLPRPITIGLAAPFARPARTAVTLVAVLLGAAAVTFAVGLGSSLDRVVVGLRLSNTEQVQVAPPSGPGGVVIHDGGGGVRVRRGMPPVHPPKLPSAAQAQRAVTAAIRKQPGTLHVTAESDQQVTVPGLARQIPVIAYQGNAAWLDYDLISGRWYTGPGQVDVPTYFLTETGKSVGDAVTFTFGGTQITARIVGEVFSSQNNGLAMFTDRQTLAGPGLASTGLARAPISQYDIELRPGTAANSYVQALSADLGQAYFVGQNGSSRGLPVVLGLISLLTLLLALVAGLGVLNTVALQTRERVHDLGVFKAIGMTPGQTIAMVVCWVAGTGLLAGLLAVPAGIALQHQLVPVMGEAAGTAIPAVILDVYGPAQIAVLALAGLAIAIAGAMAPASWAASMRSAVALRTE
jgi:putative ABC transport system permease protein